MLITLVLKKNANLFDKNWEKSPKIVIITSTQEKATPFQDDFLMK
jgi:hypothetical protein